MRKTATMSFTGIYIIIKVRPTKQIYMSDVCEKLSYKVWIPREIHILECKHFPSFSLFALFIGGKESNCSMFYCTKDTNN